MYALYSKNKPQSDALLSSHGNEFFKVRSGTSHVGNTRLRPHTNDCRSLSVAVIVIDLFYTIFKLLQICLFSFQNKQIELGDKMDLASYLLKPIQRMSKYALLLKDLIKECSQSQEQELSDLRTAEDMVKFQLRHGNDLLAMDAIRGCDVSSKQAEAHAAFVIVRQQEQQKRTAITKAISDSEVIVM